MANHNSTGKQGEALAVTYLQQKGFTILHTNWHHSYYEIDIIAHIKEILHFIEVKTRRSGRFGLPEESITNKKMQNLINAGEEFLYKYPHWKIVQYDILSVVLDKNRVAEYFFIEDVYL